MRKRREKVRPDPRHPGPEATQPGDGPATEHVMDLFAEPFARALAVFVREASGRTNTAQPAANGDGAAEQFSPFNDALLADVVVARLRRLMRARRITQAQLAERAKLSPGVVSRALKDPDRAKLATLRKIATVLDARFGDLLHPEPR